MNNTRFQPQPPIKDNIFWYLTNTIIRPMTYKLLFRASMGSDALIMSLRSLCIGDSPRIMLFQPPDLEKEFILNNVSESDMDENEKKALIEDETGHYHVGKGFVEISLFSLVEPSMDQINESPNRIGVDVYLLLDPFIQQELGKQWKLWNEKNVQVHIAPESVSWFVLKSEFRAPPPIVINAGTKKYFQEVTVGQTPALIKEAWNETCMLFFL